MMAFVSDLLGSQPILSLFLAIGLGYAVGQISILGFSLGIGAVLFVTAGSSSTGCAGPGASTTCSPWSRSWPGCWSHCSSAGSSA